MPVTNFPNGISSFGNVIASGQEIGNAYRVTQKTDTAMWEIMHDRYGAVKHKDSTNALHITVASAYAATTSNRNDVVFMTPSTHTFTSVLTWANSNTHLIGAHSNSPWSNSTIIQHTSGTAVSPVFDVTGSDCLIKNIHFIFGGSDAAQHLGLRNLGNGNMYENCWFEGPTNATQADDVEYYNVRVDGGGNYFKNCIFGTTASDTAFASQLNFYGSAYRTTFEDCTFYHQASATTARFITAASGTAISGSQFFKNCMFISWWSNHADQIAAALIGNWDAGQLIFDANCIFVGADAVAVASQQSVFLGAPTSAAHAGEYAGLIEPLSTSIP